MYCPKCGNKMEFIEIVQFDNPQKKEFSVNDTEDRVDSYIKFLYVKGGLVTLSKDGTIQDADLSKQDRFLY